MPSRLPNPVDVAYQNYLKKNVVDMQGLEDDLKIDKLDLDTELINQPSLFFKVGKFYAESISVRDEAKLNRDREQAELDRLVRQEAHESNEKITETQVLSRIKENPSYDVFQARVFKLTEIADQWAALKESYQQRSYALGHLVNLFQSNYYTDSFAGVERNESRDRKASTARERMAEKRNELRG